VRVVVAVVVLVLVMPVHIRADRVEGATSDESEKAFLRTIRSLLLFSLLRRLRCVAAAAAAAAAAAPPRHT